MGISKNRFTLLHILVIVLNSWWWVIIKRNFGVGLLIIVLSFVVFTYSWQIKSRKLFLLRLILTIVIFFIAVREAFDENIFRNSALDIQQYNKRHEFYAHGLGKIYTNKFSLYYFENFNFPLTKLQSNFFANLDPNLYFFASHPRERIGVEEFKKYSLFFLPFFLIGLFYYIYTKNIRFLIYFIVISLLSSFISPKYNLGPILFFPLINLLITIGILVGMKRLLKFLKV